MTVAAADGRKHRYLVLGTPRAQLADALLEYRQFAAEHPDDPFTRELLDVARAVRCGLREERRIMRATGATGKANAHCKMTAAQRRRLQRHRRSRLAARATNSHVRAD